MNVRVGLILNTSKICTYTCMLTSEIKRSSIISHSFMLVCTFGIRAKPVINQLEVFTVIPETSQAQLLASSAIRATVISG